MPIQVQTGAGQRVFNFNETRLEKILNARTSGEAERMGWFDRLTDRGGVKRQAIRELYASINAAAPHESRPADVLERFHRLRDLAVAGERDQFTVEFARPNDQGEWGYALSVGDTCIRRSPPGMRDEAETSFAAFKNTAEADHLMKQTIALAQNCRDEDHPLQTEGGYVDLEALHSLRTDFNQTVNGSGLALEGVDAFERLRELQQTHAPVVGRAFAAMLDTKVGTTNLLAIMYGDRAPSATSARMANLANQIISGDTLDVTAAAKHLGDQMIEQLPGGSPEQANQFVKTEFGAMARQMSDSSLSALYKAYLDQPHLIQASEPMASIGITVDSQYAPADGAENRTFWQQAMPRSQPFKWGLGAVEDIFEAVRAEMTQRGLAVKSEVELKAFTAAALYPESAEQLIAQCIGTGMSVDEAVANVQSAAPPPGALRA